ncbi:uncharacterized protein PFLUO_LOCUS896 [Penicillium psychrofluorescens]|uniref:uncharacterized protein n=1 Tax=Penicillium psychrofluorescens TaxID=3158075 RepID=UPI003CCDCBFE
MAALTPAYLAQNDSGGTFPAVIVMTVLAFIAVLLRVASRVYAKVDFWWDDWTIFAAMVCELSLTIGILYAAKYLDAGHHIQALTPWQRVETAKNLIAFQQVYFLTQTVTKVSVLLLYYRVFGVHARFRIAAYITGGIVIAWWISCFFATMFTCIPLKALWDTSIKNKTCIDMRKFGIANGSFNMITDIMVVALSVPMVWSLQLSQKKKILISGAFGMGTFVCVISVVRLSCFPGFDMSDPSYGVARVSLWTSVESCCSIIAACLPTLGPLIISVFRLQNSQYNKDPVSSGSQPNKKRIEAPIPDPDGPTTHFGGNVSLNLAGRPRIRNSLSPEGQFYRLNDEIDDSMALRDLSPEGSRA